MLLITRDPHQIIIINDNIVVKYLGLNEWGQVKLGIEAPSEVNVVRKELLIRDSNLPPKSVEKPVIKYRKSKLGLKNDGA